MDLIDTVGQKTKSETPRPRGLKFETPRRKETQENEISRLIQNASEISRLEQNFPSTIRHPSWRGVEKLEGGHSRKF